MWRGTGERGRGGRFWGAPHRRPKNSSQDQPSCSRTSCPHPRQPPAGAAGTHLEVSLGLAGVACHRAAVGMEAGAGLGKGPVPPSQEFPLQVGRDTELDYWCWPILRKTVEELRKEQPCL